MKTLKLKDGRAWMTILDSTDEGLSAGYDGEMTIRGLIGKDWYGDEGYSEKQFAAEIKPFAGKRVLLNLHSQGGNIWDAFAIHGMVKAHGKVDTKILGIAASSADLIFQAGATRIMPKLSMRMAHNPSGAFYAEGNATQLAAQAGELQKTIDRLEKHTTTLVDMYAEATGNSADDCRAMMDAEEFMDGQESKAKGFCDELTEDEPDQDRLDLATFKKASRSTAILNFFNAPRGNNNQPKDTQVNRKQKIALLNSWGVTVNDTVTDAWIDDEIAKGKPAAFNRTEIVSILKGWGVAVQDSATDAQLKTLIEAGKPVTVPAAPSNLVELTNRMNAAEQRAETERRTRITNAVTAFADNDQIPRAHVDNWVTRAMADETVLNDLRAMPARPPGMAPLSAGTEIVSDSIEDLNKFAVNCQAPINSLMRGNMSMYSDQGRRALSQNSIAIANAIAKHRDKIIGAMDSMSPVMNTTTNYGGVSVDANLQRQVIMSESMRALERRLLVLSFFAHKFEQVPLEGTDVVVVPYYPLFTTASSRFTATNGYQFAGTDQGSSKAITVGGSGPDVKVAGQDRAYQALSLSAYLIRRQPWVDIAKLATMRGEQLALDILNDIITTHILNANFGNAVWAGAAGTFSVDSVLSLKTACDKADWPETGRNLALASEYYNQLLADPTIKSYLNIGSTDPIRRGIVGGLYGFDETVGNPRIPQTADGNLVGFAALQSAILVATANIMPAPGELKLMVNYDLVTNPQTGLAFAYKYWGEPQKSTDREIIECCYGSNLGELAALKRVVSNGV